jgi:uncharacterized membrane protein YraQ (UPF0718 family)
MKQVNSIININKIIQLIDKHILKILFSKDGYFGSICATHFGVIVPVISVQTVPLS